MNNEQKLFEEWEKLEIEIKELKSIVQNSLEFLSEDNLKEWDQQTNLFQAKLNSLYWKTKKLVSNYLDDDDKEIKKYCMNTYCKKRSDQGLCDWVMSEKLKTTNYCTMYIPKEDG